MIENSGNSVIFYAHYTTDGVSTASLTVTIDIYEVIRDGTATLVVDDGACTDVGAGIYRYLLASGTVDAAAEYIGVFHTATDTVDAQDIPAMWVIDRAGTEKLDTGITLADDAITASKFDESTAYPLKSADTGSTQVARVGDDSDTLETLSDQLDAAATAAALTTLDGKVDTIDNFLDTEVAAILADTNEIQAELADGGRTDLLIDSIVGATTATGVLLKDTAIEAIFNDIVVTGSYTFAELMKIMASALAGELSGGGSTTLTFKSVDGASDVIEAIVDANGNRTSVTLTV